MSEEQIYGYELIALKATIDALRYSDLTKIIDTDKPSDLKMAQLLYLMPEIYLASFLTRIYGKIDYKQIKEILEKYIIDKEVAEQLKTMPTELFEILIKTMAKNN